MADNVTLYQGDCRDVLRELARMNGTGPRFTAIVTDPPGGVHFMGKDWDADHGGRDNWIAAFSEIARLALDLCLPGAHALVWALPRTSHWTATAWENGGWEVRDRIAHVFGSGFPKSLDVSKALDKAAGAERTELQWSDRFHDGGTRQDTYRNEDGRFPQGTKGNLITAPATDLAREWAGYGSALKPACEDWLLLRKPLTTIPFCDMMQADQDVRSLLCLTSPVKFAELFSTSSPSEQSGELSAFVQWLADESSTARQGASFEMTAMFKSPEAARTFSNIVLLWSNIWAEHYARQSRYTTSTTTALTTVLKTLSLLISQIMQACTPDPSTRIDGLTQPVELAEGFSSGVVAMLTSILTLIAPDSAISLAISRQKSASKTLDVSGIITDVSRSRPAIEDWWLLRKPLDGTIAGNAARHGCGALNVDGARIPTDGNDPNRRRDTGGYASGESEAIVPNAPYNKTRDATLTSGRFPAHLITDGSEEVRALFPTTTSGMMRAGQQRNATLGGGGYHGNMPDEATAAGTYGDTGSAARFFAVCPPDADAPRLVYVPKASRREREAGCEGLEAKSSGVMDDDAYVWPMNGDGSERNKKVAPSRNHHPTVKPISLMKYLLTLLRQPTVNLVLDPFMGSGSTGVACVQLGIPFVGIERDPAYFEIARRRIRHAQEQATAHPVAEQLELL